MKSSFIKVTLVTFSLCLLTTARAALANEENIPEVPLPGLQEPHSYLPSSQEPRRLELSISQRKVTLFEKDKALKSYPVAVGKAGWGTPVGDYSVKTKVVNPPWQSPFEGKGVVIPGGAADNPLGTTLARILDQW